MRCGFFAGLVILTGGGLALADGLSYRLPPDGTWVKYRIIVTKYEAWNLRPDDKEGWVLKKEPTPTAKELADQSADNFLLVRSVGRQDAGGEACRWIELVLNAKEEGKKKPEARVILLKVLIPEKAFGPGTDPFEQVKKMYVSDRQEGGDHFLSEVKNPDRMKYELERFRPCFPAMPKDAKQRKDVEYKTPLGRLKGDEITSIYSFEGKLSEGKSGWNFTKGKYQVLKSDKAPFGIGAIQATDVISIEEYGGGIGGRLKQSWKMELFETGKGAKSALPEKK